MLDSIWVKAILKAIVLPPTGLLLIAIVGLAIRRFYARIGEALAWSGVLLLLALSMPAVGMLLVRTLDASPPFDASRAAGTHAIVILGGGIRADALEYNGDTLNDLTLERVRYGARVARLTGLPILVAGGAVYGGETESSLMRDVLEREFDIPVRWTEGRSRTTHENAVFAAPILRSAGIDSVVLITHSFDMRRARAEFAAQGIQTHAAPTGVPPPKASLVDYLPSAGGLRLSYYAIYEILANLVRR